MATETHGIELNLKQNVSKSLEAAGKAALTARSGLDRLGKTASGAFSMVGGAATSLNQSLEIARKGMELFRMTVGDSVSKSLEFRKIGDDTTKFFKDLGRQAELTRARFGDALLPVFRGFIEAIGDATGPMSEFISKNRELIGSTLIEWLGGAARVLVTGVARGVEIVGKVFLGWKLIVSGVETALNKFFSAVIDELATMANTVAIVADAFGAKGMAKSARAAEATLKGLSDEFKKSGEAAQKDIQDTVETIGKMEKKISETESIVNRVIRQGMVNAQKLVKEAVEGTTKSIEEQKKAIEDAAEAAKSLKARSFNQREFVEQANISGPIMKPVLSTGSERLAKEDAGIKDFKKQLAEAGKQLLSSTGALGAAISSMINKNFVGAAVAIASQTEAFKSLTKIFDKLMVVVDGLLRPLTMFLDAIAELVDWIAGPFSDGAKEATSALKGLTGAARLDAAFEELINDLSLNSAGISDATDRMARELVGMNDEEIAKFGETLRDMRSELADSVSADEIAGVSGPFATLRRAQLNTMEEMVDEFESITGLLGEGSELLEETVDGMKRELSNVPSILKVALREFEATIPDGAVGPLGTSTGAHVIQEDRLNRLDGMGRQQQVNVGTVVVQSTGDLKALINDFVAEAERTGVATDGALSPARGTQLPSSDSPTISESTRAGILLGALA